MVTIKSKSEIEKMREAGRVAALAQKAVEEAIRPGISTWELDKIAEERTDIKVGKVNIDENSELAEKYGIMSIPTLVVIKNGEVKSSFVGLTAKDKIEASF